MYSVSLITLLFLTSPFVKSEENSARKVQVVSSKSTQGQISLGYPQIIRRDVVPTTNDIHPF